MISKLNILIVEDELLIAEMLKEMLLEMDYQVIAIAKNYTKAIDQLRNNLQINFVFLDINLNDVYTGMDIANYIIKNREIPFVFLTSYSDKITIQQAIHYGPKAYMIKPFTKLDLYTTLEIVHHQQINEKKIDDRFILVKEGFSNVKLSVDSILWIKSENVYIEIVTKNKKHLVRTSLEGFLEEYNEPNILRIHRSFAININHIHAINSQFVFIQDQEIPLSRKYREMLLSKVNK